MSRSRTLLFALIALTLTAAPLVYAEHPPSDERDRSGYDDRNRNDDRDGYDNRDQSGRDAPRYDDRDQNYRNLHDEVHDAIARALGSDANRIRVDVRGGRVTLSGSVRDTRSRRIAHDVAHDVPGVESVVTGRLYVSRRR